MGNFGKRVNSVRVDRVSSFFFSAIVGDDEKVRGLTVLFRVDGGTNSILWVFVRLRGDAIECWWRKSVEESTPW